MITTRDLLRSPETDPTSIYRYRDGLYAADLLTAALCHLDFITQGANAFLLLVTVVLITDPFFGLFPRLRTLIGGPLGDVRFAVEILLCHVFLALWPCAGFLLRSLLRQTRWLERMKVAGLIALCSWLAWNVTGVVFWFWPWLYQKII